jgi:DNA-binding MarR family transcriptional regulator
MESPTVSDTLEVAARLRLAVARLGRRLRQQSDTGLSPTQHSVLASIDVNRSLTLGELAVIEQVAPPTITRIVARLADKGLVSRVVDPADRRVARVSVTAEGQRHMDHSRQRRTAWLAQRLDELPPADVQRLADMLDVLEALAGPPSRPPHDPSPDTPGDRSIAGAVAP